MKCYDEIPTFDLRLLDLEVQTPSAKLNANTTTSSGLTAGMVTFYDKNLIKLAEAELYYEQFAEKKPIPKKSGKTIQFRYYKSLGKATTALTEGVTPSGQTLTQVSITAALNQYGGYVTLTDVLDTVHIDNNLLEAQEKCARQAAETRDTIIRDMLCTNTHVQYANGTKTSATALVAGDNMSVEAIRMAARALKRENAPKFDGYYVAIVHPDVAYDIMSDENWKNPHEYVDTENIYKGEIGELHGVRFVETTEAKIESTKTTTGSLPIYDTVFLGKGAYAVSDIDGGVHSIIKQLGSGGTSDPLDQRATCGWKMMFATCYLLSQYALVVKTVSSFGTAATAN